MQAVIAIPALTVVAGKQTTTELLTRQVAGVPLLKRVILTASRAGATDILLISREALGHVMPEIFSKEILPSGSRIRVIQFSRFDPLDPSSQVPRGDSANLIRASIPSISSKRPAM